MTTTVIPRPTRMAELHGHFVVPAHCPVVVGSAALAGLAERFRDDVLADCGLELGVVERSTGHDPAVRLAVDPGLDAPPVTTTGVSPSGCDPADEAYDLRVGPDGVRVAGRSALGVARGLATLRQLLAASTNTVLEAVEITDAPRYAWRGLSLDVVRCFFTPAEVRRVIDVLALYKLNVLHLHLSDDQGWRMEVPGWPLLTEVGGRGALGDRPGGHYSRAELADLVAYAADRFVTVIPEIDMPGHAGAAIAAYPQLAAGRGAARPQNLLEPDQPGVLDFARDVVAALAEASPRPFVHVGGDEAFGMDPDAYCRFIDAVRSMVAATGKRMVAWQEAARSDVQVGDIVQHWLAFHPSVEQVLDRSDLDHLSVPEGLPVSAEILPFVAELFRAGRADLARALERGAQVVLSPASHLYLDTPYAEEPADPAQAALQARLGLRLYPPVTVAQSVTWDPAAAIPGGDAHVAGIEAAIWGETLTSAEDLEFLLLPRLAGVAERAWAAAPLSEWDEYRVRLGRQAPIWRRRRWSFFASSLVDWAC